MYISEKVFVHFLPALEVCMSFFDMVFLSKRVLHGDMVMYHEWLFRSSQFLVWVSLYNWSYFFWNLIILYLVSEILLLVFCCINLDGRPSLLSERPLVHGILQPVLLFLVDCKVTFGASSSANSFFFT